MAAVLSPGNIQTYSLTCHSICLPVQCTSQPTGPAALCPGWAERVGEAPSVSQSQTGLCSSSLQEHCTPTPDHKMQVGTQRNSTLTLVAELKAGCSSYLSQPAQGVGEHRVVQVPLCEIRDQLLKLGFKQLRVRQQRLFAVCPITCAVSLDRRGAQHKTCVF